MPSTRYTVTRGKFGSPVVFDSEDRLPVAVFLRNLSDEGAVLPEADAEALNRASICAHALNRIHAELVWRKQQEK